jgi:hypothetical protein
MGFFFQNDSIPLWVCKKLLTLAFLIVPANPFSLFKSRNPNSNIIIGSFGSAFEHMATLTIPVPVLLTGLENKSLAA